MELASRGTSVTSTFALTEVTSQGASTLACFHMMCAQCGVIDQDRDRIRSGHSCAVCGAVGAGASLALPVSIHILVDLTQQAFHSKADIGPLEGSSQVPEVGTIIFFCTLREALLNWLLLRHLRAQDVPTQLIERMLDDNKSARQRFGELFKSVTGDTWKVAVSKASVDFGADLEPTSKLMTDATRVRNSFLHEGNVWVATEEFAAQCLNAVPTAVQLFCSLHNVYVHPIVRRMGAQD